MAHNNRPKGEVPHAPDSPIHRCPDKHCWSSRCVCIANFLISSLRRSCLIDVYISSSGFMEARSMRSLGFLPMANSIGALPLGDTCLFFTVAALRINGAGVLCASVVGSRFFEAVSTSAERNFLNHRTPHLSVGSVFMLFIR